MTLIALLVIGLIAGAVAKFLLPGDDPGGIIVTMVIGVIGTLLGYFVGQKLFHHGSASGFNFPTFITGVVGSLVLLIIYRMVAGRGRTGRRA